MEQAFTFSVDRGPASFLNTRAILCVHSQYNICSSQCKYISVYTVCQAGHVFGFAKIGFCEVTKHNLESCTKLLSVITIRAAKFRQIQIIIKFRYAIRLVLKESSLSTLTTCAGTCSILAAGVPGLG